MSLTNVETAAALVGHSNKMVLEHYAKPKPQKLDDALLQLSNSLFSHRQPNKKHSFQN